MPRTHDQVRRDHVMTTRPWVDDPLFWTQVMATVADNRRLSAENRRLRARVRELEKRPVSARTGRDSKEAR